MMSANINFLLMMKLYNLSPIEFLIINLENDPKLIFVFMLHSTILSLICLTSGDKFLGLLSVP